MNFNGKNRSPIDKVLIRLFPSLYVRGHIPLGAWMHPSVTNAHYLWSLHKGYLWWSPQHAQQIDLMVSNHTSLDCLVKSLFRLTLKRPSKVRIDSPLRGETTDDTKNQYCRMRLISYVAIQKMWEYKSNKIRTLPLTKQKKQNKTIRMLCIIDSRRSFLKHFSIDIIVL